MKRNRPGVVHSPVAAGARPDAIHKALNDEQQAAVQHGRAPLLIVAGAGTGKTTTLVYRVAHLLQTGVDPSRIMLLTFTRRSAEQMLERLRRLDGFEDRVDLRGIWSGTFHATSVKMLRIFGEAIGIQPRFTVHDRSDSEDLMGTLLDRMMKKEKIVGMPKKGTALGIHSFQVNSQKSLKQVLVEQYAEFIDLEGPLKALFRDYLRHQKELGIADFDSLLILMRDLLLNEQVGPVIRRRFECVLVDEYQDTNPLQAQVLKALCPTGEGLTAVGDDAQSIYSFRAATVRNILDFPKQFPDAVVLKLQQNYRSTQPLLAASNAVISEAAERYEKDLWSNRSQGNRPKLVECFSEYEQADWIVDKIKEHRQANVPYHDQAVLFRASHHSAALETNLMREKIPYVKYGGLKFAESAHVKDMLAFLRLAENYRDTVSALRVLLLIPGIGPKKAAQCIETLEVASAGVAVLGQVRAPGGSADLWKSLVQLLTQLANNEPAQLSKQLERVLSFYQPLMEAKYDYAPQRKRDLEQLLLLADRFESRAQMLVDLTLDPPNNTQDLPDPKSPKSTEPPLVLSTIHSAKGLEWPVVYTMSVAQGMLPFPRSAETREGFEEERRLLYVALTRAADFLYVTYPKTSSGGWNSFTAPKGGRSPLITTNVLKHFELGWK
jgi:DNA helicase II / ATP-dependent DNA helicase PcrA